MTFQYASDLHLEFPENRAWLLAHPLEPKADVLLLAGDIATFQKLPGYTDFFRYVGKHFKQVVWIPGNHEYYGGDIAQRSGALDEEIAHNVRLVNDTTVFTGGARILCTTLWSPIGHMNERAVRRDMNDYHQIRNGGNLLLPAHTTRLHLASLSWLKAELSKPFAGATVVMTHHVPTFMHYPPQYKGDALNEAFAVELHDLIADSNVDAWIYGHHHTNTPAFTIGHHPSGRQGTRMLTNQLGYVRQGEHKSFDTGAVLNLDRRGNTPLSDHLIV